MKSYRVLCTDADGRVWEMKIEQVQEFPERRMAWLSVEWPVVALPVWGKPKKPRKKAKR